MALRFPNPFDHSSSLALIFLKERKMMEEGGRLYPRSRVSLPILSYPYPPKFVHIRQRVEERWEGGKSSSRPY